METSREMEEMSVNELLICMMEILKTRIDEIETRLTKLEKIVAFNDSFK